MTATFEGLRTREKPGISARDLSSMQNERTKGMREAGHAAVAQPFRGITEDGVAAHPASSRIKLHRRLHRADQGRGAGVPRVA